VALALVLVQVKVDRVQMAGVDSGLTVDLKGQQLCCLLFQGDNV
jgi:hypothetical protein